MPTIHPDRITARIEQARSSFAKGETTDGRPYPLRARKEAEAGLFLDPYLRAEYIKAADWGHANGHLSQREFARIQSALTGTLDPASGWHVGQDLAVKVIVTKVCNELLELRGWHGPLGLQLGAQED